MKNHATLENFISIDNNLNAKNTVIEFANGKLNKNVLTISSSLGNGASHLAFAILNEIENNDNPKETFYASFENFLADYKNKKFQELTLIPIEINTQRIMFVQSGLCFADVYTKKTKIY